MRRDPLLKQMVPKCPISTGIEEVFPEIFRKTRIKLMGILLAISRLTQVMYYSYYMEGCLAFRAAYFLHAIHQQNSLGYERYSRRVCR